MVSIKARLERLIDGKSSKFRKPNIEPVEIDSSSTGSAATTMSTSSTNVSDNADEQQQNTSSANSFLFDSESDPYADVRQRLEELSQAEFIKFKSQNPHHVFDAVPAHVAYMTYLSYAFVIFVGHVRDFCATIFGGRYVRRRNTGIPADDSRYYAILLKSWESFFTRRLYDRVQDVFSRPIASNPGAHITILERVSDDGKKSMRPLENIDEVDEHVRQEFQSGPFYTTVDGKAARSCLNLGSYNYLGFADDWQETCGKDVKGSLQYLPVSNSSSRSEYGTTVLHRELEKTIATFLGKPDALVLTMGYNTNATTIPALVGPGDLILSDELNHTSIVSGARASGAMIRTFRHNDVVHLEAILREAILIGRPKTHRPWNKILVLVEGIYSMEGEFPDLPTIVSICKKYGAYIYLDEAHSIGAMGSTGRGIAEHTGIDTADIDIMMGTFTKSFGAMGGYIAGDAETIAYLRRVCSGSSYHNAMSPVVCQQILTAFNVIMGRDGTEIGKKKLRALRDNSNYFRMRLRELGLQVLGQYDSPIMPVMLYHSAKIPGFSRECFKRGLAVVVVGFPAVPLLLSRARFCISAAHTREDLDYALEQIDKIADIVKIRYAPDNEERLALIETMRSKSKDD